MSGSFQSHGTFRVYFRKKCFVGSYLNPKKIRKLPDFIQEKSVAATVKCVVDAIKATGTNGYTSKLQEILPRPEKMGIDRFSKGEAALSLITERLKCCKNFISSKKPVRPFCKKCKPWELKSKIPETDQNSQPSPSGINTLALQSITETPRVITGDPKTATDSKNIHNKKIIKDFFKTTPSKDIGKSSAKITVSEKASSRSPRKHKTTKWKAFSRKANNNLSKNLARRSASMTSLSKSFPETPAAKSISEASKKKEGFEKAKAKGTSKTTRKNNSDTTSLNVNCKASPRKIITEITKTKDISKESPKKSLLENKTTNDIPMVLPENTIAEKMSTKRNTSKTSPKKDISERSMKDIPVASPTKSISEAIEKENSKASEEKEITETTKEDIPMEYPRNITETAIEKDQTSTKDNSMVSPKTKTRTTDVPTTSTKKENTKTPTAKAIKVETKLHKPRKMQNYRMYPHKQCCIGKYLNPDQVARLPDFFESDKISTLGKLVLDSIIKCADDVEKVFNMVPHGTGRMFVEARIGDSIQKKSFPCAHGLNSWKRLLLKVSRSLGLCRNFLTFVKPKRDKCKICMLQESEHTDLTNTIVAGDKVKKRRFSEMESTEDEKPAKKTKSSDESIVCKELKVVIKKLSQSVIESHLRSIFTEKTAYFGGRKVKVILPESKYLKSPEKVLFPHIKRVPSMTEAAAEGIENPLNEDKRQIEEEIMPFTGDITTNEVDIDSEQFLEEYIASPAIPDDDDINASEVGEGQNNVVTVEQDPLSVLFERGSSCHEISDEKELIPEDEFSKNAKECERSLMLYSPKSIFGDIDMDDDLGDVEKADDPLKELGVGKVIMTSNSQDNSKLRKKPVDIPTDVLAETPTTDLPTTNGHINPTPSSDSQMKVCDQNSNTVDPSIVKVEKSTDLSSDDSSMSLAAAVSSALSTVTLNPSDSFSTNVSEIVASSYSDRQSYNYQRNLLSGYVSSTTNMHVATRIPQYPLIPIPESRGHSTGSSLPSNIDIPVSSYLSDSSKATSTISHLQSGLSNQPFAVPGTGIILPPVSPLTAQPRVSLSQSNNFQTLASSPATPNDMRPRVPYMMCSQQNSFANSGRLPNHPQSLPMNSYKAANPGSSRSYQQGRPQGNMFQIYRPPSAYTVYGGTNTRTHATSSSSGVSSPVVSMQGYRNSLNAVCQSSSPAVQRASSHYNEAPTRLSSGNVPNVAWFTNRTLTSAVQFSNLSNYVRSGGYNSYGYPNSITPLDSTAQVQSPSSLRPVNIVPPQQTDLNHSTTATESFTKLLQNATSSVAKVYSESATPSQDQIAKNLQNVALHHNSSSDVMPWYSPEFPTRATPGFSVALPPQTYYYQQFARNTLSNSQKTNAQTHPQAPSSSNQLSPLNSLNTNAQSCPQTPVSNNQLPQLFSANAHVANPMEIIANRSLEISTLSSEASQLLAPTKNPESDSERTEMMSRHIQALRKVFSDCANGRKQALDSLIVFYLCKKRCGNHISDIDIDLLGKTVGPKARRTAAFKEIVEVLQSPYWYSPGAVQANVTEQAHPAKQGGEKVIAEKISDVTSNNGSSRLEDAKRLEEHHVSTQIVSHNGKSSIQQDTSKQLHLEPLKILSTNDITSSLTAVFSSNEDISNGASIDDSNVKVCNSLNVVTSVPNKNSIKTTNTQKELANSPLIDNTEMSGQNFISQSTPSSTKRIESTNVNTLYPNKKTPSTQMITTCEEGVPISPLLAPATTTAENFVSQQQLSGIQELNTSYENNSEPSAYSNTITTVTTSDMSISNTSSIYSSVNTVSSSSKTSENEKISVSADQPIAPPSVDDEIIKKPLVSVSSVALSNNGDASTDMSASTSSNVKEPFHKAFKKKLEEFDEREQKTVSSALHSLFKKLKKGGQISTEELNRIRNVAALEFKQSKEFQTLISILTPSPVSPDPYVSSNNDKAEVVVIDSSSESSSAEDNGNQSNPPSEGCTTKERQIEDTVTLSEIVGLVKDLSASETNDTVTKNLTPAQNTPETLLKPEGVETLELPAPNASVSLIHDYTVLIWDISESTLSNSIATYEIYAIQIQDNEVVTEEFMKTKSWKQLGVIKALPPPMAITLTNLCEGFTTFIVVRAVDINGRPGPFSKLCEVKSKKNL